MYSVPRGSKRTTNTLHLYIQGYDQTLDLMNIDVQNRARNQNNDNSPPEAAELPSDSDAVVNLNNPSAEGLPLKFESLRLLLLKTLS
jgi:hypothetical protein